jgi:hypothetical protein
MDTLLTGEIGGGQPAAIKRRQKLSAPGGIGAGRAASPRNTVLLHGRVFITARRQLIVGHSFTAYEYSWSRDNFKPRARQATSSGHELLRALAPEGFLVFKFLERQMRYEFISQRLMLFKKPIPFLVSFFTCGASWLGLRFRLVSYNRVIVGFLLELSKVI